MLLDKKITRKTRIKINPTKYVKIDDKPIIGETITLEKVVEKLIEVPVSSQFPKGDIDFTYTRLNGKVERYMVSDKARLTADYQVYEFLMQEATCKKHGLSLGRCKRLILNEKVPVTLQLWRNHINKSSGNNSGYRDKEYNAAIGGVAKSSHMTGNAADPEKASGYSKATQMNFFKRIPWVTYTYTNEGKMKNAVHITVK